MLAVVLTLAAGTQPGTLVVEAGDVALTVSVRASVYAYEVHNRGSESLVRFEVPYEDGYDFQAPTGWTIAADGGVFRASTDNAGYAIGPGLRGRFAFRITSRGAPLGYVTARLSTQGGREIMAPRVWGAAPWPKSYLALVAGVVLILALGHTLWSRRPAEGPTSADHGPRNALVSG
jgi:hypothetical protein